MKIIEGDALTVLKTLDERSVQSVVTSPPYYNLRDYGVEGQLGLEATPDLYIANLVAVFREVRRVLRDDGTVWLNLGDSYATSPAGNKPGTSKSCSGLSNSAENLEKRNAQQQRQKGYGACKAKDLLMIPASVALALRADGWYLRSDIIWHKKNPMPESVKDRPTSAHEHVFLLSKSPHYYYDQDAIREAPTGRTDPITSFGDVADRRDGGRVYALGGTLGANARNVWGATSYRSKIANSDLTDAEKDAAYLALIEVEREVADGELADFRMRIRGVHAPFHGDGTAGGGRQQRLDEQGFGIIRIPLAGRSLNVWTISNRAYKGCHFATMPIELADRCIKAGTKIGDVVLDPFAGAGTTGYAVQQLGRDGIMVELNADYCALMRERLLMPVIGDTDQAAD